MCIVHVIIIHLLQSVLMLQLVACLHRARQELIERVRQIEGPIDRSACESEVTVYCIYWTETKNQQTEKRKTMELSLNQSVISTEERFSIKLCDLECHSGTNVIQRSRATANSYLDWAIQQDQCRCKGQYGFEIEVSTWRTRISLRQYTDHRSRLDCISTRWWWSSEPNLWLALGVEQWHRWFWLSCQSWSMNSSDRSVLRGWLNLVDLLYLSLVRLSIEELLERSSLHVDVRFVSRVLRPRVSFVPWAKQERGKSRDDLERRKVVPFVFGPCKGSNNETIEDKIGQHWCCSCIEDSTRNEILRKL